MKCYKCNKEVNAGKEMQYIAPPTFSPSVLHLCCKWEGTDCHKNYDKNRLKAIDEWLKKCKDGYKWSGGELDQGKWEKRPSDEAYEYDKDEDYLIKEAKEIRRKWNIKDSPQER